MEGSFGCIAMFNNYEVPLHTAARVSECASRPPSLNPPKGPQWEGTRPRGGDQRGLPRATLLSARVLFRPLGEGRRGTCAASLAL
jgi:hypothetical protein